MELRRFTQLLTNLNKSLKHQFDTIEAQREALIKRIANLSEESFNHQPEPGKWSIHQILAHLITGEKMTVQYIQKKIQGIDTSGNTGVLEEIKMAVLKISQRLPLKFKAPGVVIERTNVYASKEALIDDWNKTRAEFQALLEKIEDNQLRRKIYKHVVAGRLNILHATLFLKEHVTHHLPQINRLLK